MTISLREAAITLGGEAVGRNRILCPGPGHRRRDRSLSVTFTGDDFLVHSFAGDDFRECRDHVKAALGLVYDRPISGPPAVSRDRPIPFTDPARIDLAGRIWSASQPLSGTAAEAYLSSRGLSYDGDALRFHPACRFGATVHPALVALMTDAVTSEPCGIHRTALLANGSGKASPGKMMLGRAAGAVVRLSGDDEVRAGLAIAEGIETALAAQFLPIWACLSAGSIGAFPVLKGIESLTIFADHDAAGIVAANDCGARWHEAGREVTVIAPTTRGADMADMVEAA